MELLSLGETPVLHGEVRFGPGDKIGDAVSGVPDTPGAYIIWGLWKGRRKRLYLGKGATAVSEGAASTKQTGAQESRPAHSGLRTEILNMRVDGRSAQGHFDHLIETRGLDSLRIEWFVTVRRAGDVEHSDRRRGSGRERGGGETP